MSPLPRTPRNRPAVEEFEVTVDKSHRLGVDIIMCKGGKAMVVKKVAEDGAVKNWNDASVAEGKAAAVVRRGDRVVEVNGCGRGDGATLRKELGGASGTVTMSMVRLNEFMVAGLPNFPRDSLGLDGEEDDAGHFWITKVGAAANASLQPDLEIRPGDRIMKVNGNTSYLKAEMMSHDALTLRIRRGPYV